MYTMYDTDVVVIGGGQAGLAMSHCLTESSIDHVVLERGESANSWTTERWDSLRLLTPNWLSRLPGWQYRGDDPEGYMTATEVAAHLAAYGKSFGAPIVTGTTVREVTPGFPGFRVETDNGVWRSRAVVIATGACSTPKIPAIADSLPRHVRQIAPIHYRNPNQLDDGRVLVVGASASGIQIADELARSGRDVTVAVGDHVRLPRSYRGMDIHWWLDTIGLLDERIEEIDDLARARRIPSLQLIGTPEHRTLDLNSLSGAGVSLTGRLAGINGSTAQFSGSFANHCASADLKMNRLLERIDEYATGHGLDREVGAIERYDATDIGSPRLTLDLDGVDTVVWATGFKPNYPWLPESVLDRKGAIVHDGGVLPVPGMYALGLPMLRTRKSVFLDGVGADAIAIGERLVLDLHLAAARV